MRLEIFKKYAESYISDIRSVTLYPISRNERCKKKYFILLKESFKATGNNNQRI
jgi:hypothetical protein